jgi:cellobiose phosphorylase
MDSVWEHLGTPHGFKVLDRGYDRYDPEVGSISVFPPGLKENASVFNHASTWVIVAEAVLGRGAKAYEALRRMSPATKDAIQHVHCAEPYVVCQTIVQPPNRQAGRGMNAWLTGTASWFYHAMCQYILGVRPALEGLRVSPCVPGWERFTVRRVFRGARYDIEVLNPRGAECGVAGLTVDGREVEGDLVPLAPAGSEVNVLVEMGG